MRGYIILLLLFLVGCSTHHQVSLRDRILQHVVIKESFWSSYKEQQLVNKIYKAPTPLIEYVLLNNQLSDMKNIPHSIELSKQEKAIVQQALKELPTIVKKRIAHKLIGIFFVQDLGSSGYTEMVYDAHHHPHRGFMVFDIKVLKKSANNWATWKENTPFKFDPNYSLSAIIEQKDNNNIKNAFQYIFLHEAAHVLAIGSSVHPSWMTGYAKGKTIKDYPFLLRSWKDYKGWFKSKFDKQFKQRSRVAYYRGNEDKLPSREMLPIYRALEHTNFTTLYAATNPFDDFAETFVTHVHENMMHRPFKIILRHKGKVQKVYTSCAKSKRCRWKYNYVKKFISKTQTH